MMVWAFVVAILFWVAYVFPAGIKYFFVAPLMGLSGGMFLWAPCALIWGSLCSLPWVGGFVLMGILASEIAAWWGEWSRNLV